MGSRVFEQASALAEEAMPGFVGQQLIARSVKTHLIAGTLDGEPVVAKVLSNEQPIWRWYLTQEVAIYRAFDQRPPPVAVPRFLGADLGLGVLLLEQRFGTRLARGRVAGQAVTDERLEKLIAALEQVCAYDAGAVRWPEQDEQVRVALHDRGRRARPLPDSLRTVSWMVDCVPRWRDRAILPPSLAGLAAERLAEPLELSFAHGDLLLRNVILTEAEELVFVDWEFAGRYPWGWDLGMLWVGLGPQQRAPLERFQSQLSSARQAQLQLMKTLATARELEVRRFSLRQGDDHLAVIQLEQDISAAGRGLQYRF